MQIPRTKITSEGRCCGNKYARAEEQIPLPLVHYAGGNKDRARTIRAVRAELLTG